MVKSGKSSDTSVNGQPQAICKGCGREYASVDERQLYCTSDCRVEYHGKASKEGQKVLASWGPKIKVMSKLDGVEAILRRGGWYTAGDIVNILVERYNKTTVTAPTDVCDLRKRGKRLGFKVETRVNKKGFKEHRIVAPPGEGVSTPPATPSPPKGQGKLFK